MASKRVSGSKGGRSVDVVKQADDLKEKKAKVVSQIFALKAESAKIASQLANVGVTEYAKCW